MRTEYQLPFGLLDPQGKRARTAALTPITGRGELFVADDLNPFRAALELLAASTLELGPFRGAEIGPSLLGRLLPVDRDYLLLQLNRMTFGDVRYHTVECPHGDCGRRVDVRFDLSSVDSPRVPDTMEGTLEVPGGRVVRFRLPLAADQAALHGLSPAALEPAFLQRCVRGERIDGRQIGWPEIMEMPAPVRADLVKHIVAASPEMDLAVPLDCPECGRPFRFVFDPILALFAELKGSRAELLRQVHCLALSYHWSHSEILDLSRPLRHEYLHLLQEERRR